MTDECPWNQRWPHYDPEECERRNDKHWSDAAQRIEKGDDTK